MNSQSDSDNRQPARILPSRMLVVLCLLIIIPLLAACFWLTLSFGADFKPGFVEELVTDELTEPTCLAAAPDGRIFVSEKAGKIRIIENGVLLPDPFLNIAVDVYGERGLSSILLDPDFIIEDLRFLSF